MQRWRHGLGGGVGVVFGGIGVAVSLVGLAGVWVVQARLKDPLMQMTGTLVAACDQVSAGVTGMTSRVEVSRVAIQALDERVSARIDELRTLPDFDFGKLMTLRVRAEAGMTQLRGWLDVAEGAVMALDQVKEGLAQAVGYVRTAPEARGELRGAIDASRLRVDETLLLLEDLGQQVEELQAAPASPETTETLDRLCTRLDEALLGVILEVTGFSERMAALSASINDAASRIVGLLWVITLALSLLLIWHGTAQYCLLRTSLRLLALSRRPAHGGRRQSPTQPPRNTPRNPHLRNTPRNPHLPYLGSVEVATLW